MVYLNESVFLLSYKGHMYVVYHLFSVYSCVQYTRACVGMGVTLAHNSNGRQEPCMHHKSLLSLVSSISSKQGHYGGQVPHLCFLCYKVKSGVMESNGEELKSKSHCGDP